MKRPAALAERSRLLCLMLFAFALRVYHLDAMSFWSDEGISVLRARFDPPTLLANLPVEHNPLYFLMLHFWMQVVGEGDFAVRYLSLFFSVLLVPVVYQLALALQIGKEQVGLRSASFGLPLLAALFAAVNPLQIWYAQEARMYSLVVVLCAGAAWTLLKSFGVLAFEFQAENNASESASMMSVRPSRAPVYLLVFVLCSVAALYTHFFAALALGALGAWALFAIVQAVRARHVEGMALDLSDWHFLKPFVGSFALLLVLLIPWFPRALAALSFPGWQEAADPLTLPARYWVAYSVGATGGDVGRWLSFVFLALFLIGASALLRQTFLRPATPLTFHVSGFALPLFYVLMPFLAMMLLALRKPGYHERYLIVITPLLFIIWAVALTQIRATRFTQGWLFYASRFTFHGSLIICLLASALSLANLYFDPTYAKPDFRAAAQYIDRQSRDGDGLIFDGPDPHKAFYRYFSRQRVAAFDMTNFDTRDPNESAQFLSHQAPRHERWWVVLYFHPPGPTEDWLARNGYQTSSRWFNGIRVLLYATPSEKTFAALSPRPPQALQTQLPLRISDVRMPTHLQAGDVLPLAIRWQVDGALPADYQVSLRLVNGDGKIVQQRDRRPLDGRTPTSQWRNGEVIEDRYGLLVPADAPVGVYRIEMIMYLLNGGEVLKALVSEVNITQ